MLEDIAILTGGEVISEELGLKLENTAITQLGTAKTVKVDKDNTTIINGAGKPKDIQDRIAQIKKQVEDTTSDYDKEKLQERLASSPEASPSSTSARHRSRDEGEEAQSRGPLSATRPRSRKASSPRRIALIQAALALDKADQSKMSTTRRSLQDHQARLEEPIRQIAENAGVDARSSPTAPRREEGHRLRRRQDGVDRHGQGRHHRPPGHSLRAAERASSRPSFSHRVRHHRPAEPSLPMGAAAAAWAAWRHGLLRVLPYL